MSHYLLPNWPAPKNVKAFTSLRSDGHSSGSYASFNLNLRDTENPDSVLANRLQLKQEWNLAHEPVWLTQVHGTVVIQADKFLDQEPQEADASYTNIPGIPCVALSADCLPLLLCNQQGTQVAAIHAGWRGLLSGVIEATLEKLQNPGDDWLVWLGPAIGPTAFEVGDEVHNDFVKADPAAAQAFTAIAPNKWLGNMYTLAKLRLAKYNIQHIYGGDLCTYSDPTRFYSFRRDEGKTGRMASIIFLEPF